MQGQDLLDALVREAAELPATLPAVEWIGRRLGEMRAQDAAAHAELLGEQGAQALILLAGLLRGDAPDADHVGRLLPFLEDFEIALLLMWRAEGDRLGAILTACDSGRLGDDREAAMLFLATELLEAEPAPPLLKTRIRLLSRKRLSIRPGHMLGAAALAVEDEDVESVAERWVGLAQGPHGDAAESSFRGMLDRSVSEVLPEAPPEEVEGGYTICREAPKIGRNAPCPCGSGRKFKKCCGAVGGAPEPGGVRPRARPSPYSRTMTWEQFLEIRPMDLVRLDPKDVASEHLAPLLRGLTLYCFWEQAEQAMDELAQRAETEPAIDADGHRFDFFFEAVTGRQGEVARRQAAALPEEDLDDVHRLALDLCDSEPDRLTRLEQVAREGLASPEEETLTEFAHLLQRSFPALGILVTRGVLDPDRDLDAWALLESVEESRDRLLLPPDDPAGDHYDCLTDMWGEREAERITSKVNENLAEQVESLRARVGEEGAKARGLTKKLREQERALDAALAEREFLPVSEERPALSAPIPDEELRTRVVELKTLLKASNHEKAKLRRKLSGMSRQLADEAAEESSPETDPGEDPELPSEVPERLSLLLPEWGKRFEGSLREVPESIARGALRKTAALAGATPDAWVGVKRMKAAPDIRTIRLGHSRRLLFRVDAAARRLVALEIVHRRDLDAALHRHQS